MDDIINNAFVVTDNGLEMRFDVVDELEKVLSHHLETMQLKASKKNIAACREFVRVAIIEKIQRGQ